MIGVEVATVHRARISISSIRVGSSILNDSMIDWYA